MIIYLFYCYILSPHIPHESDYLDSKKMVIELLNAGAHTDFVNKCGVCPHTGYLKSNYLIFYMKGGAVSSGKF
jgi:hypothetical protein